MSATDDLVSLRFRAALDAAHGDRVEQAVLFGSRTQGDHRPYLNHDAALPEGAHHGRTSSKAEAQRGGIDE